MHTATQEMRSSRGREPNDAYAVLLDRYDLHTPPASTRTKVTRKASPSRVTTA